MSVRLVPASPIHLTRERRPAQGIHKTPGLLCAGAFEVREPQARVVGGAQRTAGKPEFCVSPAENQNPDCLIRPHDQLFLVSHVRTELLRGSRGGERCKVYQLAKESKVPEKTDDVRAVRLLTCKKLRFRVGSAFAKFFSDSSNHPFVVLAVDRR